MINPNELWEIAGSKKVPVAVLREKLAGGLQQETEEERSVLQKVLSIMLAVRNTDAFLAVLDAICKEVIMASHFLLLFDTLRMGTSEAVMAVVERMRNDDIRVADLMVFKVMLSRQFEKETEDAVISVMDPTVFGMVTECEDVLCFAVRCNDETIARAVELVLTHGPSMEDRLEAGIERFRYVNAAADRGQLDTLQQMHDLLPLLPDGSGRRGELADYAGAIVLAVGNRPVRSTTMMRMLEYLAEQAGDEEVFDLCPPTILVHCKMPLPVKWLVYRAPQLLEAACNHLDCLLMLTAPRSKSEFLVEQMVELVDPKVLCGMMRTVDPARRRRLVNGISGWRRMLKPVHEAVPESMDGLRWQWLVEAIEDVAYEDVEYMLGMCTREHLVMRNEEGDTAYDIAARDEEFPPKLLKGLEVVHMAKGAHVL